MSNELKERRRRKIAIQDDGMDLDSKLYLDVTLQNNAFLKINSYHKFSYKLIPKLTNVASKLITT